MLHRLDIEEFDSVYKILHNSCPTDERRPYEIQKALLLRSDYSVLTVRDTDSDIKAFLAVYELETTVFIEHFAVSPEHRNQGLGSLMLNELINSTDKPVCLEAEPPVTDIARRRIAFYQRNGFCLNDYPYIQPALAPNQSPVELKIMSSPDPLTASEFDKLKILLYTKVYG